MALRITPEQAYERGYKLAKAGGFFTGDIIADIESYFPGWRQEFPLSAHLDYREEIVKLWHERLNADLDLTKYPECRGLADVVHAEQRGYLDGCGGNKVAAAYHYNWSYFLRLRLNTRYFGFTDEQKGKHNPYLATQAAECTAIWFADTPDGPAMGKNLDTCPRQILPRQIPSIPPRNGVRGVAFVGGATAAVLCDDEPDEIFPVNLDDILPEDIRTVRDYVAFRNRYRQFCGPGNGVYADESGDSVAIEQTNCLMGWRFAENGISAVTGLAYQTPELKAFKAERDQVSLDKRGWDRSAPDWAYWRRCNARYDRLMKLVAEEAGRRPTLEGMARILLDPHTDDLGHISVANEPFHPDVQTDFWTMCTWVSVPYGEKRRTYRWAQSVPPSGPIYEREPEVVLDDDVPMRDEFEEQRKRLARIGKN